MEGMSVIAICGILGVIAILFFIAMTLYQKCGPNQALIVTGFGENKVEVGGGTVVFPLIHKVSILQLETMTIDVKSDAPLITKSGVRMFVEGVAQIKVRSDREAILKAAQQFLDKDPEQVAQIAHQTLIGHLRAILGTMEVEELIQNFERFSQRVQEVSAADLDNMGMEIVSFTIKEIKDNQGYLEALGRHKEEEVKRLAAVAIAENQKLTQIAQAQASREAAIEQSKASRDAIIFQAQSAQEQATAKLKSDTLVAESTKEFQLKQAQYQQEIAAQKASSDMAYEIAKAQQQQQLVQQQQQIRIVEASKEVELQQVAVQRRQVELEAEITKPAEAEQSRVRLIAQAEQDKRRLMAEADALSAKLQAQGQADATRLRAIADAEAQKAIGLAQAEAQRAKGLAEASVIAAKGEAEAEAMAKKAEAFKQYNEAAMASMVVDKLPDLVAAAAAPLQKIGQMTVLATGDTSGASKISADVLNIAAQGMTMVKGLTGIDVASYMRKDDTKKLEESAKK
jgi:flotillin